MSSNSENSRPYALVIPAGGTGQRMQTATSKDNTTSKQLLTIHGKTILRHAIDPFLSDPDCKTIVIAAPETEISAIKPSINDSRVHFVSGGKTRMHSVINGLTALKKFFKNDSWVMVHDAARANLHGSDLQKLKNIVYSECSATLNSGGILAIPARDTLKRSDANVVLKTLDRSSVWQALTPQMFRLGELYNALEKVSHEGLDVTDDSSAMENSGARVILVHGRTDNIKLTYPEDLPIMEKLIEQRNPHNNIGVVR